MDQGDHTSEMCVACPSNSTTLQEGSWLKSQCVCSANFYDELVGGSGSAGNLKLSSKCSSFIYECAPKLTNQNIDANTLAFNAFSRCYSLNAAWGKKSLIFAHPSIKENLWMYALPAIESRFDHHHSPIFVFSYRYHSS